MSTRGTSVAIGLLKAASALDTAERAAKGLKGLVVGATDVGAGVAKGLGAHPHLGRAAVVAGGVGAGVVGAKRVKRKADELKFRLMYGDPAQYY